MGRAGPHATRGTDCPGPVQHRRCRQRRAQRTEPVNQSHTAATLARLQAVDWTGGSGFKQRRSRVRLMAEYLRRAALWAQDLDATSEWPFFDIAAHVDPSIQSLRTSQGAGSADLPPHGWPSVDRLAEPRSAGPRSTMPGVPTAPAWRTPSSPPPDVRPRRWLDHRKAGFIDLGGAAVRKQTWRDHLSTEPITALDPATLDALDEAAN